MDYRLPESYERLYEHKTLNEDVSFVPIRSLKRA